jgi:uncharacterized membrane protein YeaQ/YmgE (transglycosylase-associated protein family)
VGGWVFDIVVGWVAGSVIGGLLFDLLGAFAGTDDSTMQNLQLAGVVIGTVLGIAAMRRLRAWREYEQSR